MSYSDFREKFYELHQQGQTGKQIAETYGCSMRNVEYHINQYTRLNRIRKPIKRNSTDPKPMGLQYRELYENGMSWRSIAKQFNKTTSGVHHTARSHSINHGLPWPVHQPKKERISDPCSTDFSTVVKDILARK